MEKINGLAFQCKIQFNTDPNKQANEVIFSRKLKSILIPLLLSTIMMLRNVLIRNILGIILYLKLDFDIQINKKIEKCYKVIGLIKRLSVSFSRKASLTFHKSIIRPHLEYGDILYDKPENQNFQN